MIGMMNEHITAPIISGILKHEYSQHKQTEHTIMCPFISHLIIKHINCVRVFKKTLFNIAAAKRLALMTDGDDREEASKGEVSDTLMNQFRIQFRLVHTLALKCMAIHRNRCRVQYIPFIGERDYTVRVANTVGNSSLALGVKIRNKHAFNPKVMD